MRPLSPPPSSKLALLLAIAGAFPTSPGAHAGEERNDLRAGAYAIDITPGKFPVIVNGMFEERSTDRAHDPLYARCLALEKGPMRVAIVVVDSCMMPRDLLDEAKELARQAKGIPPERILISATHTHSAPAAMGCLGSRPDSEYQRFLPGRIATGIERALANLVPARVGWAVERDFEHTHCRRWIRRPDRVGADPFGGRTVRANMHPGHQSPDVLGPSGPVDPDLSVLSVQSLQGRPIALLSNYSMHYFGSAPLSADYFGRFAEKIAKLIGAERGEPPFVGIMSQGTSGDLAWMDYSKPAKNVTLDEYAEALAQVAYRAYRKIEYRESAPLDMREAKLTLRFRTPSPERLAWARKVVAGLEGRLPRTLEEIYAREQVFLLERPTAELKVQAIRIGDLGIAAIPNEVFGITGLKIKLQSPLVPTFNIELANGSEGYIPPPEQHRLGGYTTWEARTAGLETEAEPKIVEAVLGLLEEVSSKPRRGLTETHGPYPREVLGSKPVAYWRLGEIEGGQARDATGRGSHARYEGGLAFYLPGPQAPAFSGQEVNRSPHLAGGRILAEMQGLGSAYTIEMWFWNGLPHDARPVTGCLFSKSGEGAPSEHLALGGTSAVTGQLFFTGSELKPLISGKTVIQPRTWNYLALVRQGKKVALYLNGGPQPEIQGETGFAPSGHSLLLGGSNETLPGFEGKIDEVAVYDRALTTDEISRHHQAAGILSNQDSQ